jgi:multimeric flavodoxin WrbA
MITVLGLAGSPRRNGNTELLLDKALAGAASLGGQIEKVVLADREIYPCRHCDGCIETGICIIKDDMQYLHSKLKTADRLILATPLFFMSVTAQTKLVIDRCQALWVEKYLLNIRRISGSDGNRRRGLFLSVGGLRRTGLFDPARATVRAFFATCDLAYYDELLFPGIDSKGTIKEHPSALQDAFTAGCRLVTSS